MQKKAAKTKGKTKAKANARAIGQSSTSIGDQYEAARKHGLPYALSLAPGTAEFARVLRAPWTGFGSIAKFPVLPVLNTQTVVSFNRDIVFQTGTGGIGFLAVAPATLMTSDIYGIFYTTGAAYAGTPATPMPGPGPGVAAALMTSPYTGAMFNVDSAGEAVLRGRLLGVGMQVWYEGTELARAGHLELLAHPNKESLLAIGLETGMTPDQVSGYLQMRVAENSEGAEIHLTRPIIDETDTEFLQYTGVGGVTAIGEWTYANDSDISTLAPPVSQDSWPWLGVVVRTAGLTQQVFRANIWCVFEAYGKPAQSASSRGVAPDPMGVAMVTAHHKELTHNAPAKIGAGRPAPSKLTSMSPTQYLSSLSDFARRNMSWMIPAAHAVSSLLS